MALAEHFGVELIGGDVSGSPGKLVIDSVVGGDVKQGKAILRSGAKPGDKIFVTGKLGGAAGGLKLLKKGVRYGEDASVAENELLLRQLTPWPRVEDGRILGELGASSMIDLSDGISSDLRHICNASGVGAFIDAEAVPLDNHLDAWDGSFAKRLDLALNGGEDFELLFTADTKKISPDDLAGFTCIGEITANAGIIELIHKNKRRDLKPKGFQHFG
jgi:thiamine-monophosphate kinase